jgi:hypothetical protein
VAGEGVVEEDGWLPVILGAAVGAGCKFRKAGATLFGAVELTGGIAAEEDRFGNVGPPEPDDSLEDWSFLDFDICVEMSERLCNGKKLISVGKFPTTTLI